MNSSISVGDADALIALTLEKDPHHKQAIAISTAMLEQETQIVFPITVFPEAITSLVRAANQPQKAHLINSQLQKGAFHVQYIDEDILLGASKLFEKSHSKQNTFFDAIVAATADKLGADSIFSFDRWYTKLGYTLAG